MGLTFVILTDLVSGDIEIQFKTLKRRFLLLVNKEIDLFVGDFPKEIETPYENILSQVANEHFKMKKKEEDKEEEKKKAKEDKKERDQEMNATKKTFIPCIEFFSE